MANILVGNKNTILSSAFNAAAKTLTISNCTMFDLVLGSLVSVWDSTTSSFFSMSQAITCTKTNVGGLPVFTYTFSNVPAGVANGDTLVIQLSVPQEMLTPLLLQVIAGATI